MESDSSHEDSPPTKRSLRGDYRLWKQPPRRRFHRRCRERALVELGSQIDSQNEPLSGHSTNYLRERKKRLRGLLTVEKQDKRRGKTLRQKKGAPLLRSTAVRRQNSSNRQDNGTTGLDRFMGRLTQTAKIRGIEAESNKKEKEEDGSNES